MNNTEKQSKCSYVECKNLLRHKSLIKINNGIIFLDNGVIKVPIEVIRLDEHPSFYYITTIKMLAYREFFTKYDFALKGIKSNNYLFDFNIILKVFKDDFKESSFIEYDKEVETLRNMEKVDGYFTLNPNK